MKTLAVGGVPEHFNLPWHLWAESGEPARQGIQFAWKDFPDGSGAMAAALTRGEIDVAMLLTEGAVAGIADGGRYSIVSLYTESPLLWGIHVPASSELRGVDDASSARFAISRYGSGSHLMCYVLARRQGWLAEALSFVTVRSLSGAIEAFAAGTAEVFLWEKYMTQPIVDDGRFRRIGELVAPWPAFVVCASERALARKTDLIAAVLPQVLAAAARLASSPQGVSLIADRYGLHAADVVQWLRATRWATSVSIEAPVVDGVVATLREVGLLAPDFDGRRAIAQIAG